MISGVSFDLSLLPPLLRFDGVQAGANDSRLLQFTELDPKSASYGASFYLDAAEAIAAAIIARREVKRKQFAGEAPLD